MMTITGHYNDDERGSTIQKSYWVMRNKQDEKKKKKKKKKTTTTTTNKKNQKSKNIIKEYSFKGGKK